MATDHQSLAHQERLIVNSITLLKRAREALKIAQSTANTIYGLESTMHRLTMGIPEVDANDILGDLALPSAGSGVVPELINRARTMLEVVGWGWQQVITPGSPAHLARFQWTRPGALLFVTAYEPTGSTCTCFSTIAVDDYVYVYNSAQLAEADNGDIYRVGARTDFSLTFTEDYAAGAAPAVVADTSCVIVKLEDA